jgi:hypothetical protein
MFIDYFIENLYYVFFVCASSSSFWCERFCHRSHTDGTHHQYAFQHVFSDPFSDLLSSHKPYIARLLHFSLTSFLFENQDLGLGPIDNCFGGPEPNQYHCFWSERSACDQRSNLGRPLLVRAECVRQRSALRWPLF